MTEAPLGEERVSKNGYTYIKRTTGWELKHRVIAEKTLGRPLLENERVRFKDKDRTNLDPNNLIVFVAKGKSKNARRAAIEAKIEQLQAELEELDA